MFHLNNWSSWTHLESMKIENISKNCFYAGNYILVLKIVELYNI